MVHHCLATGNNKNYLARKSYYFQEIFKYALSMARQYPTNPFLDIPRCRDADAGLINGKDADAGIAFFQALRHLGIYL
jgi:hypothetical protein